MDRPTIKIERTDSGVDILYHNDELHDEPPVDAHIFSFLSEFRDEQCSLLISGPCAEIHDEVAPLLRKCAERGQVRILGENSVLAPREVIPPCLDWGLQKDCEAVI